MIGTFRHGSLFVELLTEFGSNIIAENDPHYVPDVRLMALCELTSGSVFGHVGIFA